MSGKKRYAPAITIPPRQPHNRTLTPEQEVFCDTLREERQKRDLTMHQLAQLAQVAPSTIQNIELRHTDRKRNKTRGNRPNPVLVEHLMQVLAAYDAEQNQKNTSENTENVQNPIDIS